MTDCYIYTSVYLSLYVSIYRSSACTRLPCGAGVGHTPASVPDALGGAGWQASGTAVVTEIRRMHKAGRPTLVGTTSVERSEALAKLLDAQGAHQRRDRAFVCLESLVKSVLDSAAEQVSAGQVRSGLPICCWSRAGGCEAR